MDKSCGLGLNKMAASVHDTEEATATAFKIMLDERVSADSNFFRILA